MEQKIMLLCSGYGAETGSDLLTFISTAFRKMGFLSRPAKRFSFRVENCAICMPGKRHCMRAAMEPGISLQWIMISKKSVGIAVRVLT